jgi:hypothetical protein
VCNEIIELDNGKYTNTKETTYFREKEKRIASENAS